MAEKPEATAAESEMDKPSAVIAGFQLLKRVGRGGMGTVYRARQISVDRIVAVKILKPSLARNKSFIVRFSEEAKAAAKLNHPNIVQAIDAGEENGYYYFAMEYVDGEPMHRLMLREGVIDERKALKIALDVAHALGHAQAHHIVHRDIKPGNIMLTRDGMTKLCDLGLARVREEEEEGGISRGQAVGTPYYISPEQAMGQTDVDTRSDIYSLGATIYRALAGRPAFDAPTPAEILEKHVRAPLPWPRDHNPALTDNVCYVIAKMMAKKPDERYQSPDELAADIERALRGEAPKSTVVQFEVPPARLSESERAASALTQQRLRQKRAAVRQLSEVRGLIDKVAAEQGIPHPAVIRLLHGNLDESKADTFLKYGCILLAEGNVRQARREFRQAARLGADVSHFMAKLDALGAPAGMVYVPAGEFLSGPPEQTKTVTTGAFYIDKDLVTNARYFDFMRATNAAPPAHWVERKIPDGAENLPVVNITWEEARAYAEWAGKHLPSVAEWEKAARGTDGRRYPWGNVFDRIYCNTQESGIGTLTAVGRYKRGVSPFGCDDMIGNVVQWCSDTAPAADNEADGRAVCGVSFEEPGANFGAWRVEFRKRLRRSRKCGFRCALNV